MIKKYIFCLSVITSLIICSAVIASSQSNTCVVTEKQGSLVTMTCPGEGTKVINMGGSADIYKPGDSIRYTEQGNKSRQEKRKAR